MAGKAKPKTGERRKTRQPFKINSLPQYVRDAILDRRAKGRTWQQIEDDSHEFVLWNELDLPTLDEFPSLRIPRSSLQRWHDVHIEQVQADTIEESRVYEKFAKALAGHAVDGDDMAVVNAMRNEVFALAKSCAASDRAAFMEGLKELGLTMTRIRRVQLQEKRVTAELAKSEAERAKFAAEAGDPHEIYILANQDLLKKLRTRSSLRAVLDPIREELLQEIAHGAEAFAKHIQATAS